MSAAWEDVFAHRNRPGLNTLRDECYAASTANGWHEPVVSESETDLVLDTLRDHQFTAGDQGLHMRVLAMLGSPNRTVGDLLMLTVTELAEALEEVRAGNDTGEVYFRYPESLAAECPHVERHSHEPFVTCTCGDEERKIHGKPEGFGVEIVDAIIRLLDLAGREGIDLDELYQTKMDYNATRGHRHGGKTL